MNMWYNSSFSDNEDSGCMVSILKFVLSFALGIVFSLPFAIIGVWLWDYAVVSMFGLPEITFLKMFSLMILVRLFIFFGLFRINNNNS